MSRSTNPSGYSCRPLREISTLRAATNARLFAANASLNAALAPERSKVFWVGVTAAGAGAVFARKAKYG